MSTTPRGIAVSWLSKFGPALTSADVPATVALFQSHGWLRDALVFTWDTRSIEGADRISSFLANTLPRARIESVELDETRGLQPELVPDYGVAVGFTFETGVSFCRGRAYLALDDVSGEWKAISVCTVMEDLKGYPEIGPEPGVYGGHTISWEEVKTERRREVEVNPYVVIIGAGQTGLNIAARFKQMDIPTIVVERHLRVGDQWRQRYPTLSLHTTRMHHSLLYQPYPKNWPIYTPRDKVADWQEQYVNSQDLIVWTNSYILSGASYDAVTKKWDVVVNRDGSEVRLTPAHIVCCIGTLGAPRIPSLQGEENFKGDIFHASRYIGGHPYVGKHAVVIGAGNTSADICQDLSFRGAKSVTMVQRSSTCVIAAKTIARAMAATYPEDLSHEVVDFKFNALPLTLQRRTAISHETDMWEREKDLHADLRKGGLKLNMGRDGSGQHFLIYERSGGFWIDVGCGPLIGSGKVKVKQGVEPVGFMENRLLFSDGSELEADVVVYATGYLDPRDRLRGVFGSKVIDQTSELWGLDVEGEVKGSYRPSGHPGLWYAGGDFSMSRYFSKQLGLQIKARQIKLVNA